MKRTAALDYLTNEYADFALEAGFDDETRLRAYWTVINSALRLLGYHEDELPSVNTDDDETPGYLAALDYFVLSRYARVFAIRTDVSVGGAISAKQSQSFLQVNILVNQAKDQLSSLGLTPGAEPLTIGRLTLDFLEPDDSLTEGAW